MARYFKVIEIGRDDFVSKMGTIWIAASLLRTLTEFVM